MMTNKRFAKIDKVLRGIDKSTEVADNLGGIAGEVVEMPEYFKELEKGRKDFKAAVVDAKPERSPANKPIEDKQKADKEISASPEITPADMIKPEVSDNG
jgi:hypothetical protein